MYNHKYISTVKYEREVEEPCVKRQRSWSWLPKQASAKERGRRQRRKYFALLSQVPRNFQEKILTQVYD